jgi:hypothetical protein
MIKMGAVLCRILPPSAMTYGEKMRKIFFDKLPHQSLRICV